MYPLTAGMSAGTRHIHREMAGMIQNL